MVVWLSFKIIKHFCTSSAIPTISLACIALKVQLKNRDLNITKPLNRVHPAHTQIVHTCGLRCVIQSTLTTTLYMMFYYCKFIAVTQ